MEPVAKMKLSAEIPQYVVFASRGFVMASQIVQMALMNVTAVSAGKCFVLSFQTSNEHLEKIVRAN